MHAIEVYNDIYTTLSITCISIKTKRDIKDRDARETDIVLL